MTHQRVTYGEEPCFGPDPETTSLRPSGKLLAFVLLVIFVAISGYENHLKHSYAWGDRWLGMFWLSGLFLVGSVLLSIPRIANSRATVRN